MMYRRRIKSDCWHFVTTCRWWPVSDGVPFKLFVSKPKSGEFCNECLSKAKHSKNVWPLSRHGSGSNESY